jgi:hypothetical protein
LHKERSLEVIAHPINGGTRHLEPVKVRIEPVLSHSHILTLCIVAETVSSLISSEQSGLKPLLFGITRQSYYLVLPKRGLKLIVIIKLGRVVKVHTEQLSERIDIVAEALLSIVLVDLVIAHTFG